MRSVQGGAAPEAAASQIAIRSREIRLVTGLVLGAFLLTHFSNHALGLVSVEAMEAGRAWFNRLWRNPVGTVLLYGSILVHFLLALLALYRRRTLRMPLREAAQLALGVSLPFLLIAHVVGTRIEWALTGHDSGYPEVVRNLWVLNPDIGARQAIALVIAWLHGCLGIYFWLRPKPWFSRAALILYTGAILVPVLALLGFAEAGRDIAEAPERLGQNPAAAPAGFLPMAGPVLYALFGGLLAATVAARFIRSGLLWSRRVRVFYPNDQVATVPLGFSVLEASRIAGIPHISVCGGRGRCSTCRVRVTLGAANLPPPTAGELKVLQRVGAAPDVRLACQLRPTNNLTVTPLLPAHAQASDGYGQPAYLAGQERMIAVMFADIRSFTGIAETKLPYDLVFFLNSYFAAVGIAIASNGGMIDKFVGDGVMALFGVESGPEEGCRQALAAARAMIERIDGLSGAFAEELSAPLRIGIGIHCGPAVVGRMGYGESIHVTAIGDTVNVASRLQDATKEFHCQLVLSEEVAKQSGLNTAGLPRHELTVRNRREALTIYALDDVSKIAERSRLVSGDRL